MEDLKALNNVKLLLFLAAVLVVVAGLYMADLLGWPRIQSSRLARAYTGLLAILMMTVVPACVMAMTAVFLVIGFYW